MDNASYLTQVDEQCAAMRAAAVAAGPDAAVASCPGWTMQRLVGHLARVYNWVHKSLTTGLAADPPRADRPPADWTELLAWWDAQRTAMVADLRAAAPETRTHPFLPGLPTTAAFWARRQAHETAIHRLDAELAAGTPTPAFAPEFAADGIDELFTVMLPGIADQRPPVARDGRAVFHATDTDNAWAVTLRAGEPMHVQVVAGQAGLGGDAEAGVVGTADAVYRAVWNRPSDAVVSGDPRVLEPLRSP